MNTPINSFDTIADFKNRKKASDYHNPEYRELQNKRRNQFRLEEKQRHLNAIVERKSKEKIKPVVEIKPKEKIKPLAEIKPKVTVDKQPYAKPRPQYRTFISKTQEKKRIEKEQNNELKREIKPKDFSQMIIVRIDHKTQIYINPGDDVEQKKKEWLEKRAIALRGEL